MNPVEAFSGSPAPTHQAAPTKPAHGPVAPLDGTLGPTVDPELAELHAAVDQLAAAVAAHTTAIDALHARIHTLDGDGR